jgi:hypothetical protein
MRGRLEYTEQRSGTHIDNGLDDISGQSIIVWIKQSQCVAHPEKEGKF